MASIRELEATHRTLVDRENVAFARKYRISTRIVSVQTVLGDTSDWILYLLGNNARLLATQFTLRRVVILVISDCRSSERIVEFPQPLKVGTSFFWRKNTNCITSN